MTKPKSATSPPVLVLYGLDADGRPRAAAFNAVQADLAKKAAESLELQVLRIQTAEQLELARQVPSGEILAPGRGNVPVVRKELFDKLLALVPTPDSGPSQEAASAAEVDAVPSATTTDNSGPASKAPPPRQPPTTWAEIDVGDLVLAENWDPETGWYEAVVLEQIGDDELKLRFRDYPEEGTLVRRRNQLALLSPA
ncbi:MAG: hypothetical protein ABSD11_20315 [Methylocella sp.]|jgi:hypothetical protein